MHSDQHIDLYDRDSVENNLRYSANGSLVTSDDPHSLTNILTGESESRWQRRHAVVVHGLFAKRIQKVSFPKRSPKQGTMMRLQRFRPPDRKPKNNPHRQ